VDEGRHEPASGLGRRVACQEREIVGGSMEGPETVRWWPWWPVMLVRGLEENQSDSLLGMPWKEVIG